MESHLEWEGMPERCGHRREGPVAGGRFPGLPRGHPLKHLRRRGAGVGWVEILRERRSDLLNRLYTLDGQACISCAMHSISKSATYLRLFIPDRQCPR